MARPRLWYRSKGIGGFYVRQRIDTQDELNQVLWQKFVGGAIAIAVIGVTLYFAWPLILFYVLIAVIWKSQPRRRRRRSRR